MIINLHSYIYIYIIYIIYDGRGCTVRCANFLILHWFTTMEMNIFVQYDSFARNPKINN